MAEVDLRYDDPTSVPDDTRLLRCIPHDSYKQAEGDVIAQMTPETLETRLSTMGFQTMRDRDTGLVAMSVYVESVLPDGNGAEQLRDWWAEVSKRPQSVVALLAGALRAGPLDLGVVMAVVPEPFGTAHAHAMHRVAGGAPFKKPVRNKIVQAARVVLV